MSLRIVRDPDNFSSDTFCRRAKEHQTSCENKHVIAGRHTFPYLRKNLQIFGDAKFCAVPQFICARTLSQPCNWVDSQ